MKESEQESRLAVDVTRLDPDGEVLEGELFCVDVDEEFVHPFGGVRYRLDVRLFGTELLVRGHLEQDFDLVCSRCGEDFDTTVKVEDFTESYEVGEKIQEVDLTEDIRESIILTLPSYPVCREDCPGIVQKDEKPVDDRWNVLNKLKVEG